MVDLRNRKYGVDISDGMMRIVGRSYSAGRVLIDRIVEIGIDRPEKEILGPESELYLAISERDSIIKMVTIPTDRSLDSDKVAQFELMAALLDGPEKYYLETYATNGAAERLAVAYNRGQVDRRLHFVEEKLIKPRGFKLRSLAMAAGYLNYCRPEGGKFLCLVDISGRSASYCFLRDNCAVDVGIVGNDSDITNGNGGDTKALVLDLLATIRFKLAGINRASQSLPLSRILITGASAGTDLAANIETALHVSTSLPQPRKELFSPEAILSAEKNLVGLGLTISD